jgi:hypothetical protein
MKVVKPTLKQKTEANLVKSKTFARLLREKDVLLRSELVRAAQDRGLWSDEQQKELNEVRKEILDGELQLQRGGKTLTGENFSREQAKNLSIKMMELRGRYLNLNSVLGEFQQFTCEAQSEQAEFDYLCSVCILNDDDSVLFKSIEDYLSRSGEAEVMEAADSLSSLISDYDPNWYDKLPEVSFLLKYKFINDEHQLIDENGNIINDAGKKINKDGQLVNEHGELVNEYGEKVDSDGNILDFVEFVD